MEKALNEARVLARDVRSRDRDRFRRPKKTRGSPSPFTALFGSVWCSVVFGLHSVRMSRLGLISFAVINRVRNSLKLEKFSGAKGNFEDDSIE